MDKDDIDYFPRAGKRAQRDGVAQGEYTKETNLRRLEASGLKYALAENDEEAIFRQSGRPNVRFYTRRNRWKVAGAKKTTHGTVDEFIGWYRRAYLGDAA
jgi:hypothetical protein